MSVDKAKHIVFPFSSVLRIPTALHTCLHVCAGLKDAVAPMYDTANSIAASVEVVSRTHVTYEFSVKYLFFAARELAGAITWSLLAL